VAILHPCASATLRCSRGENLPVGHLAEPKGRTQCTAPSMRLSRCFNFLSRSTTQSSSSSLLLPTITAGRRLPCLENAPSADV
jgi:hypothetical protein